MYVSIIAAIVVVCIILLFTIDRYNYDESIAIRKAVKVDLRLNILTNLYNHISDINTLADTKIFLIYGTLLGKIRNDALICYDYDVDFGVEEKDYKKVKQYVNEYYKNNTEYKVIDKDFLWYKSIKIEHIKTSISTDISPFAVDAKSTWRMIPSLYAKYVLGECRYKYPKEWVFPLVSASFLGKPIYIPNNSN